MKAKVAVFIGCVVVSGCVKLQILPDDTVKNTIRTTKNLYDEAKLKRSGGERRSYARQVRILEYATQVDAETGCVAGLLQKAAAESSNSRVEKVSETVSIPESGDSGVIACELIAYVWP